MPTQKTSKKRLGEVKAVAHPQFGQAGKDGHHHQRHHKKEQTGDIIGEKQSFPADGEGVEKSGGAVMIEIGKEQHGRGNAEESGQHGTGIGDDGEQKAAGIEGRGLGQPVPAFLHDAGHQQ